MKMQGQFKNYSRNSATTFLRP